jgi:ribose transport system permease protein
MTQDKKTRINFSDWFLRRPESGIVLILILFVAFATCVNPSFLSYKNVINILRASGFTLISVVGMALILITGGLDLAIGSVYALGALISGIAMTSWNLPIPVAILLGLIVGLICGTLNGVMVVKAEIPPMIATLGMQYIARGAVSVLTKGVPIYPLPDAFINLEPTKLFGAVPIVIPFSILIAVIGHLILSSTVFGRSVYAIGGNQDAARISGINIARSKMIVYIVMSVLAALAGILMSSRLGSAEPSTGTGLEMKVICAAVIGGISVSGGLGTMLGASLGALFMEALTNSLTVMRISVYWQNIVFGVVLVLSVLLDQYKRQLIRRRSTREPAAEKHEHEKS